MYLVILSFSFLNTPKTGTYVYPNIFYNYIADKVGSEWLILLINHLLLITGAGITINIILNEEITDKQNFYPVFIFFALNAICVDRISLSIFMISNIVVLFAIQQIFRIYRLVNVLPYIFSACFWISVSMYINIVNLFFIPLFFITLIILRPFYWREFANALLGIMAPVFIYESITYLFNSNQWYIFESSAELFSKFRIPEFSTAILPFLGIMFFILVVAIIYFLSNGLGNTVKKQKAKSSFFWFMLLVSPAIFTNGVNDVNVFVLLSTPLSFLIGDFLFQLKSKRFVNLLLVLISSAAIYYLVNNSFSF